MIKDSPDLINATEQGGLTPLQQAALTGRVTVAAFLLKNGAEVNAQGNYGRTALYAAAENGHKSLVELLLAHGADVNRGRGDITPLHVAALKGVLSVADTLVTSRAAV